MNDDVVEGVRCGTIRLGALTDDELDALVDHERHHPNPAWVDHLLAARAARIRTRINDWRERQRVHALGMIEAAEQIGLRAPAWCYEHANPSWVDHLAASFLGRLYPRGEGRFGGTL